MGMYEYEDAPLFIKTLAARGLRIVPSEPVAWLDGIHRGKVPLTFEHARSPGHPICTIALYADPEDSK